MVAIMTGNGLGLERGSGSVLGSRGALGTSAFNRYGENVTVNAATGNLVIHRNDEILIGVGPDNAITRSYNSLGAMTDDNGDNWQLNAQRRVTNLTGTVNTAGSAVTRIDWDGSNTVYTWDAGVSAYVSKEGAGSYDRLTFASNVWTWTDGDSRIVDTFDHLNGGRITATKDTDGNQLTYSYTGTKLTRITTANGEYTDFSWSGNNLTEVVTGLSGGATLTRVRYTYDGSNRLSTVTTDLTPNNNSIADGAAVTTTYTYSGSSKRVVRISQTGGGQLDIGYTLVGSTYRVTSLSQITATGVTSSTTLSYDTVNRVTTITDALSQVTKMTYDTAGQLTRLELPPAQSGEPTQNIYYTYNANGDLLTVKDASNAVATYEYDTNGDLTLQRDPAGNTITRTYGTNNELLTETRYAVADPDGSGALQAGEPATTRYAYDAENHLRFEIDSEGGVKEYLYTAAGQVTQTVEYPAHIYNVTALAPTTTITEAQMVSWKAGLADKSSVVNGHHGYDARGQESLFVQYHAADSTGMAVITDGYYETHYTHDSAGNLLTRYRAGEFQETFVYDGLGRVIASTNLDQATTNLVFTDGQNKMVATLANGFVQTSIYNRAGQLISYAESGTGFTTATTAYKYDALGRLRMVTDASNRTSYYLYDAVGRKVADITADGAIVEYGYDASDRLIKTVRYATKLSAGQLSSLVVSGEPANVALSSVRPAANANDGWEWNVYDLAGRLAQRIDGQGNVTAFAYDGMSNLIKTTQFTKTLSANAIAAFKANPPGAANRIYNADMTTADNWGIGWDANGISGQPYAMNMYGTNFVKSDFSATASGQVTSMSTNEWWQVTGGERLSFQAGVEALGPIDNVSLAVHWQDASGATIGSVIIGSLYGAQGFDTKISGFVTAPAGAVAGRLELYMTTSGAGTGSIALIKPMVAAADPAQTTLPAFSAVPLSSANDEISRVFYDKEGRQIGALDGAGYLSQIVYDAAGQKIRESRYANATTAGLRATGTFAQLLTSAGTNNKDHHTRYVYDGGGNLRYKLDANLRVTEYVYTAHNAWLAFEYPRQQIEYAGTISPLSSYDYASVKAAITTAGLASNPSNRSTWAIYDAAARLIYSIDAEGNVIGYNYDAMGRVVKTTEHETRHITSSLEPQWWMDGWAAGQASNPAKRVTRTYYDLSGRVVYSVDAENYVTEYRYDAADRVTLEVRYAATYSVDDSTTTASLATAIGGTIPATAVQTSYVYDAAGRMTDTYDGLGTRTTYFYDALDRVLYKAIAYGSGDDAITNYSYDAAGRISTEVHGYGESYASTISYTYDGLGNILTRTDGRGSVNNYTYDAVGNVLTVTESIAIGVNAVTTNTYDAFGNLLTTTDPRGNTSYRFYDNLGRLTMELDAERYATVTGYNFAGEIASVTRYAAKYIGSVTPGTAPTIPTTPGVDATTSFTRDKLGRVTRVTDALGNYEDYTLNAFGDRVTVTNKLGRITTNSFDRLGRLTRESYDASTQNYNSAGSLVVGNQIVKTYQYDSRGNTLQLVEGYSTSSGGAVTALRTTGYTYDLQNQLTLVTHDAVTVIADDMVTTSTATPTEAYTYDKRGNVVKTVDAGGAAVFSYYDDLNRKIAEIRQLTATQGAYTRFDYDKNGNVTSTRVYETLVTLPVAPGGSPANPPSGLFRETAFTYDNLDRLLTSTVVSNGTNTILSGYWNGSSFMTATGDLQTQYQYDANGNVVKLTDANGAATWSWYDQLGRKTSQLDAEGYLTSWTYDAEGNALTETRKATQFVGAPSLSAPPSIGSNANDRITTYTYDRNGNRLTETRANVAAWTVNTSSGAISAAGTDAAIVYTYNALGQVMTKTVAGSLIATYIYDNSGRLQNEQRASFVGAGDGTVTPVTTYYYDATGNRTVNYQSGGDAYPYTVVARITFYRYGEGGRLISMTDAENNVHNYFYDAAGRLKKDAYARTISASTAANSSATTTVNEAQTTVYDIAGRAVRKGIYSTVGGVFKLVDYTSFQYNVFDQVTQQGFGSNSASDINSGSALYQITNKYDAAGNLVASNAGDGVWKLYSYDGVGNQTGLIASAGASFSGSTTFSSALSIAGQADVNGTWTVYDKRGLATQVVEEGRGRSASATNEMLTTARSYNAFGEVVTETDANLNAITYTYNTMGRMIRSESPAVEIKGENGAAYWIKPSEDYYYDLGGRLIGTRDANGSYATTGTTAGTATTKAANTGNLTSYALLEGTGYDGSQSLISIEFHSDGGKKQTLYDSMGDARVVRSELFDYADASTATQFFEERYYNRLGQLTGIGHARRTPGSGSSDRLFDNYVYDQFGQRIQHTNTLYGSSVVEKTAYDALGRVVSQTDMEDHVTNTAYAWDGTLTTSGLATYGGWAATTSYSDSTLQSTVKSDIFDREIYKSDLGGHVFTTAYDAAGRAASRTTGVTSQTWQWYNTGLLKQSVGPAGTEDYSYDKTGNRLTEKLVSGVVTVKDATATYDALGRLTTFYQAAASYANGATYSTPDISNQYYYDAVGNIRQTISTHDVLNSQGGIATADVVDTYWFRYDSMNRLIVDKGVLSGAVGAVGTTITRANNSAGITNSHEIQYDAAGQRTHVIRTQYTAGTWDFQFGYIPGFSQEVREHYTYQGDGALTEIRTTIGAAAWETVPFTPPTSVPAAAASGGTLASSFTYDLMGRQTGQSDYDTNGTTVVNSRTSTFNKIGQLTYEATSTLKHDNKTYTSTNTYTYANGAQYLLGAVYQVSGTTWVTGASTLNTLTTNAYQWFDGAVQSTIAYKPDTGSSTTYNTTFYYDAFGQLNSVYIADGRPRSVYYKLGGDGQILRRDEIDGNGSNGDPHEIWYRFNGRELSYTGNDSTDNLTTPISISDRRAVTGTGAFRNGGTTGISYTDSTGGSYEAINSYSQGSAAGGYIVQTTGENLRSVALAIWGDAALWYKLADANGLQADAMLVEGQRLNVPAGVTRSSYSADTLKPYDANDAIGNVSPTTPKPKKSNKCGGFGQILLAAVAIAVTVIAPFGAGSIPAIMGNAAAGSVVSQGVGIATGIQDKFSFKAVGMAGISALVGGQLGSIGGSGIEGAVLRGVATSAITQGVGVAIGLQSKFSWAGVAAAGVGAGIGQFTNARTQSLGKSGSEFVTTTASTIANAATRSALTGTSFGDNIMHALPDALGGLAGRALGGAINSAIQRSQTNARHVAANPTDSSGITVGEASAEIIVNQSALVASWNRLGQATFNAAIIADGEPFQLVSQNEIDAAMASTSARVGTGTSPSNSILIVDGDFAGQLSNNTVSSWQDGVHFEGGKFGYLSQGADGNARFVRLLSIEAMADANTLDVTRSAIAPLDTFLSGASIAQGSGSWADYFNVSMAALPAAGKLGEKFISITKGAIPTIGGRLPVNSKYAGKVHPSGVKFTEQGFPNFKPYSQAEVEISNLTGRYSIDSRLANAAMGYPSTPQGYLWHHVEDGVTMQLIPKAVHGSVRHTGGAAVIRNGGFD